ncbi:hypothetical protein PV325_002156 [Microctonus aethiopoides]|nr:hypothetical protein PV325_002156 [Microctonus aethiopoides]
MRSVGQQGPSCRWWILELESKTRCRMSRLRAGPVDNRRRHPRYDTKKLFEHPYDTPKPYELLLRACKWKKSKFLPPYRSKRGSKLHCMPIVEMKHESRSVNFNSGNKRTANNNHNKHRV